MCHFIGLIRTTKTGSNTIIYVYICNYIYLIKNTMFCFIYIIAFIQNVLNTKSHKIGANLVWGITLKLYDENMTGSISHYRHSTCMHSSKMHNFLSFCSFIISVSPKHVFLFIFHIDYTELNEKGWHCYYILTFMC